MHNAEIINKQSNSSHLNNMAQLGLGYTRTQAGFKTPISAVTGFSMSGAGRGLWRGSPSHPTSKLLWAEWHTAAGLIWEQCSDQCNTLQVCLSALHNLCFNHACNFYWDSSCCRLRAPYNRNGVGKVAVHTVSWHGSLQIPGLYEFFLISFLMLHLLSRILCSHALPSSACCKATAMQPHNQEAPKTAHFISLLPFL